MTSILKAHPLQGPLLAMGSWLLRCVRTWWNFYGAWRVRRETVISLARLSDLQLKDIGLHRSEVDAVVRETKGRRRDRRN